MSMFPISLRLTAFLAVLMSLRPDASQPHYVRVHELVGGERVFAYARATADGRYLAYTSERPPEPDSVLPTRVVTVVDLLTHAIVFSESGLDAYWSNDGSRMIYESNAGDVNIRHQLTGQISRQVAPLELGDYFSWAVRDGKDLVVTILSNYYYLQDDRAVAPFGRVPTCPDIGIGERPLVSHDGNRITTFVRGTIVVRNLTDCENIIHTGIRGGKADFSWDGRYVATHVMKPGGSGYEIQVIDLEERTVRTVASLPGSSRFPSWLRDGRLLFNYDSEEYRGFMIASDFAGVPARPLPIDSRQVSLPMRWDDIFPQNAAPEPLMAALIWSDWSAHSAEALIWMQQAHDYFRSRSVRFGVVTAVEPSTDARDALKILRSNHIDLPTVELDLQHFFRTDAPNQIPATLLFRDGLMIDSRMGAQTFDALLTWVSAHR